MAHHDRGMDLGDHSKMELLFEIETICQSGKAAKNRLFNSLSAKSVLVGEKLVATYSIST